MLSLRVGRERLLLHAGCGCRFARAVGRTRTCKGHADSNKHRAKNRDLPHAGGELLVRSRLIAV